MTAAAFCDYGTAAAGPEIVQTLPAGTYYVGLTGNSNTGGATSGELQGHLREHEPDRRRCDADRLLDTTSVRAGSPAGTVLRHRQGRGRERRRRVHPARRRRDGDRRHELRGRRRRRAIARRRTPSSASRSRRTKDVAIDLDNSTLDVRVRAVARRRREPRSRAPPTAAPSRRSLQRLTPATTT